MKAHSSDKKHNYWLHLIFIAAEIAVIILYAFCTKLDTSALNSGDDQATFDAQNAAVQQTINSKYPMYMNIHAMIFVGFGFLMVFLKTNCWSGVGFNFLIACWAIQINILMLRFWEMALIDNRFTAITLNLDTLI
jgi:ammonium transporter Rh